MLKASVHTAELLRENWQRAVADVAEACRLAGRGVEQVKIVGVSKYVGPELAWQLVQAGCHILAENRPQLLWEKVDYFARQASLPSIVGNDHGANIGNTGKYAPQWHLIGHLQRNKLRRTLPIISLLHSLDSLRLAEAISAEGVLQAQQHRVLLEVNVTEDASKTGMAIAELRALLDRVTQMPGIEVCGLMAMSSHAADSDRARREFEQVRDLRDQLQQEYEGQVVLSELSMGMSGDFRQAITAGATLVRIGSNLWQGVL